MLNDDISKILRENREVRDVFYSIYSFSSGQPYNINKPGYVNMASQKFHLPVRKITDILDRLIKMKLIDNNGQTLKLRREATNYVPEYLKSEFEKSV